MIKRIGMAILGFVSTQYSIVPTFLQSFSFFISKSKAINEFISANENITKRVQHLIEGEWQMIWSSQIFHTPGKNMNVNKAIITIEYVGVGIKMAAGNFQMGVSNKTPEFLKMNPIGKTPEGPLFESNTIARYVAHGSSLFGSSKIEYAESSIASLKRGFDALNNYLASHTFLVGDGVTLVEEEEAPKSKPKNPLDLLPPSNMVLDDRKRLYSNTMSNFCEVAHKGIYLQKKRC
ncbi:putative elongation factor 1B gamma, glutathione S-transferase, Thioredoxin-like superfamily [Helianthus annuus]|nr:putative elongation factor 1B gamma, glutathione S-transferase, Thioredoxin-like superfamily [Helianthus annuus]KAJ0777193.1 putative elongation factor 1B gamma, glutathione S-transferase, Thioredoxin-like superfamily [Helianthus annuus]KAJ0951758.1 putative elongation factor 1B gamma, glutathione S-transferase, Thioredoxin-like superfamily [Helianthus annuus]